MMAYLFLLGGMGTLGYASAAGPGEHVITGEHLFLQVTGQVTASTDGMPLAGASIQEKGTDNGVVADFDGNFSIEVSGPDAVLVVSYVGFKTTEVAVGGQEVVNVVLQEDLAQLDEVVVVGYGEQKRETVTGSVATIQSKDLAKSPTVNVSNAIAGECHCGLSGKRYLYPPVGRNANCTLSAG